MTSNTESEKEKAQSISFSIPLVGSIMAFEPIKTIAETNQVGAALLELNKQYYNSVLEQARQSFTWALVAAIAGLFFFLGAVGFLLLRQPENISYVSVICGSIVEAISGLNFYLYGRAASQLKIFHIPLDRTQRFILANDICSSLGEKKEETRAKLILTIANVPTLTDSLGEEKGNKV